LHSYAQTNIELINQLLHYGYSNEEIIIVIKTYDLAILLFTGQFQSSGRTQIAHGIGTASILASLHLPIELVAAGVIHNVYDVGDFGDGKVGAIESRRGYVRNFIGSKVEEYLFKFNTFREKFQILSSIQENVNSLSEIDRHTVLLILADMLDHHSDRNRIYNLRDTKRIKDFINHNGDIMIELAKKLGFQNLASELSRAFKETLSAKIPGELLEQFTLNRHSTIAPKSYRLRSDLKFLGNFFKWINFIRSRFKLAKVI
jgi:(p)ppGpp synthase/HD superfamily hydrolase